MYSIKLNDETYLGDIHHFDGGQLTRLCVTSLCVNQSDKGKESLVQKCCKGTHVGTKQTFLFLSASRPLSCRFAVLNFRRGREREACKMVAHVPAPKTNAGRILWVRGREKRRKPGRGHMISSSCCCKNPLPRIFTPFPLALWLWLEEFIFIAGEERRKIKIEKRKRGLERETCWFSLLNYLP